MDWRAFVTVFGAIFLAELGDKTQLAVLSFTTSMSRVSVLLGASLALVASTVLAVAVGQALLQVMPAEWLRLVGALIFLAVGVLVGIEAIGDIRAA
ncbi:MAG: TMEM165/GDT1 family protein [Nitriliruptorales bacterium]